MNYVLDSFAILAYLGNEEGADKVEEIIDKAEKGEEHLSHTTLNNRSG